jgi:hypothetical protein
VLKAIVGLLIDQFSRFRSLCILHTMCVGNWIRCVYGQVGRLVPGFGLFLDWFGWLKYSIGEGMAFGVSFGELITIVVQDGMVVAGLISMNA